MATTHESSEPEGWLVRALTSDFCPGFNRYVYWLKEPIGWFVLAAAVSLIIGRYFNPIGWTIGASLIAVIAVGVAWPWIAVRGVVGELRPEKSEVHEGDDCRLIFAVRSRLPVPVWGLSVEGYLTQVGDETRPTVGLSSVPPVCSAEYPISVRPTFRGRYPAQPPKLACGFPFGIWTARRELQIVRPLTVWPKVYSIRGVCPFVGVMSADEGEGQRGGRSGDFVGVRPYRRGDSLKHLHWAHLARTDQWIISERGGPQSVDLEVALNPYRPSFRGGESEREAFRQSLSWRVRVAASVLVAARNGSVPVRFRLGDRIVPAVHGRRGIRQWLDELADIPGDGIDATKVRSAPGWSAPGSGAARVAGDEEPKVGLDVEGRIGMEARFGDRGRVHGAVEGGRSLTSSCGSGRRVVRVEVFGVGSDPRLVQVVVDDPRGGTRAGGVRRVVTVDCRRDPATQLDALWQELGDAHRAA